MSNELCWYNLAYLCVFMCQKIGLQRFVPCCLDTEPGRVEWTLQTRCHPQQPLWFDCYIDAGYVNADDKTFSFQESPEMQTLQVIGLKVSCT